MAASGEVIGRLPIDAAVIGGLITIYVLFSVLASYWRLRDMPGPFWAKFTDAQRMSWVFTKKAETIHLDLHKKYGEFVRLGPNMISLSDPVAIPELYPMRPGFIKAKQSLFYRGIMPYIKGGAMPAVFTTQDEAMHKKLRTPISSLYSTSHLLTFEPFVDDVTGIFFEQLDRRFAKTGAPLDIGRWLQFWAYDLMGTMTFSKRYGFLETGEDINGLMAGAWDFNLSIGPMTQWPLADRILYKSPLADVLKNQVAAPILRVVSQNVDERTRNGLAAERKDGSKSDFLSYFIRIQREHEELPDWACRTWTYSNVIAGSDSVSAVLRELVYQLLANPESLSKLLEELRAADASTGLSKPYPKWNEVKDLPYLDACFHEASRLHPPFCLPFERIVPKGGVILHGHFVPEGTCVGMNPYVVNRHKPTFGDDVETWRPERFMADSEAARRKLTDCIMTFGAGRRVCAGKFIAIMEIKKIVPALFLNYKMELLDPGQYWKESSYFYRQHGILGKLKRQEI
ncbi:cytochrome P450 [Cryphonectria parasitica EP155]|uniref:Cytochrome P450 n=1 Tax=Cryphonectria parasitica (strain ATCC 38755 / EP155) TaxID=660469 RepID=A0A9P5CV74_CRYP1|nr:cytochrome P450 [Cryphonectria parasitica EP155]KAF3771152.1 cytochrome P450 [Cryphonectria parasitica EP155]